MYYILYRTTMYMYRTALIRHVHVLSQYKLHIRFETTFTAAGGDERGHSSEPGQLVLQLRRRLAVLLVFHLAGGQLPLA